MFIWQISIGLSFAIAQSNQQKVFLTPENDDFIKTVFTTENGLPQNTINAMVQTRDGYLWFATNGGLVRFDGVKFTTYVTSNTPNLVNIRIRSLYEDRNGVLWIGTENESLISYQDGKFSLVYQNKDSKTAAPINQILFDKNNLLWLGLASRVKVINLETKEFQLFKTDKLSSSKSILATLDNNDIKESPAALDINEDRNGNIWLATEKGLAKYQDGQFTNYNEIKELSGDIVRTIRFDSNGSMWIITDKMVGKFENGIFTPVFQFENSDSDHNNKVLSIYLENDEFFIHGQNLYKISGNKLVIYNLSDIIKTSALNLVFDTEGNLWIGGKTELVQLRNRRVQVFNLPGRDEYWSGMGPIIETPDKIVWSGAATVLLRFQNGKFEPIPFTKESGFAPQSFSFITSLAFDKDGTLWVGAYTGITTYKAGRFYKFDFPDTDKAVGSLFFDKDGALWIGKLNDGLRKYVDGKLIKYSQENGLVSNLVTNIMQDRNGVMWIGTREGLSRLEDGNFTNFTTDNGLTTNYVRDIYEDQDGTLWIGTYGGGILRFRNGQFVPINSTSGLPEDVASRIFVDEKDNFWVLGNQGIYSVNRQILNDFADGKIKLVNAAVYGVKDGMETSEGNGGFQPAGWRSSDGKLWFPTIKGGVIIDPKNIDPVPPPIYIEKVLLDKKVVDTKEVLRILPGQENLEINYTAINFTKPDQLQFRYKLENYDSDWQYVGTRRTAFYTSIPPGDYTFKVMAISADGILSQQEASFSIKVAAPFWKTTWFYLLMFLLLLVIVNFIYQFKLQQSERKRLIKVEFSKKLINAHEFECKRIASELHDGVGQQLLIIRNWALLCLRKISDNPTIKQELDVICEYSLNALQEIRDIARNLRPQQLQQIGLTKTLVKMINHIEAAFKIKFQTEIDNIDNLISNEEELSIYRVIQECLNNIVKHSEAQHVQIMVKYSSIDNLIGKIMISIVDDGKGFNLDSVSNTSFGLDNIVQRTELLEGKVNIDSSPGNGTKITILLKVNPKHEANVSTSD